MIIRSKRARITEISHAIIANGALEYPRVQRTRLAETLQKELGRNRLDQPEVEVLEKWISHYRNNEADDPENRPWGMGSLGTYPIPSDGLKAVLAVWKLCLISGWNLTIREAKWTARLYSILGDDNYESLRTWASMYSVRERVCIVLKKKLDTSDLDAGLVMPHAEVVLTSVLGLLKMPVFPQEKVSDLANKMGVFNSSVFRAVEYGNISDKEKMLISFLSKGPRWQDLTAAQRHELRQKVRLVSLRIGETSPMGNVKPGDIIPFELMKMVGIETLERTDDGLKTGQSEVEE